MCFARNIHAQRRQIARSHAAFAYPEVQRFARRGERGESADRRGIVNDPRELIGQAKELRQPAHDDFLEFGGRGRSAPEHRFHVERGGERFCGNGDRRSARRKICEEARAVPVRDAGKNHGLESRHQRTERLGLLGGGGRQTGGYLSRRNLRKHRIIAHVRKVAIDPGPNSGKLGSEVAHDGVY